MMFVRRRASAVALCTVLLVASGLAVAREAFAPGVAAADTTFTFDGGGWGHAVGMSQWGAKGRADAGQSAAQIIAAYYTGTQITGIGAANVRVHLADTAGTTVSFTAATTVSGNGGALASVAAGETVEIKAVGAAYQLQVTAPTVKAAVAVAANDVLVVPLGGSPARLDATGNRYNAGRLVFRLTSPGSLQVVNDQLTMQQYLYGLGEVPSSWPAEALKAQALAARTYAYKRVQSPRSANYDILSTTSDQVYVGYEKQAAAFGSQWVAAVNGTDGQIITYQGAPIDALYSSSNGGYSEDSEYAFVSVVPYLRANADPYDNAAGNPNFRWSRSYTGTELGAWIKASRGVDIGAVTTYEISGNLSRVGRIDRATVRFTGTTGTTTVTGSQLRNLINANAPSNRQLLSTLLFFRPMGFFDNAYVSPGVVTVTGWALYQGSSAAATVQVSVNGRVAGQGPANLARADVAAAVPGAGVNVGFAVTVPLDRASNEVCVSAVSPAGNASTVLSCRTINVDTQPFGSLDVASPVPGGVRVRGWAMDPNSAGPTDVHVYVNGRIGTVARASTSRPDVGTVFPAYGSDHGYDAVVPVDAAVNTVCVYAINVGPGDNVLLGCRTVTSSVQPFGSLDSVTGSPDGIRVSGWAIDPDTVDPIDVHVYTDGVGRPVTASGTRVDVGAAFPGFGDNHGFSTKIPAAEGGHQVCVYAINVRAGGNQLLGCRIVTVPADPFGAIDVVRAGPDGIRVSGWAIDPNTNEPIDVHVYLGTNGVPVPADRDRPDLAGPFPDAGTRHGFDLVVPGRPGQTVCIYAINTGPGANRTLGCRVAG